MVTFLAIDEVKTPADTGPKLTRDQKAHVVKRLAYYETPTAIAKSMTEDLGIEITRQAIAFYDPTRYSRRRCPKCWSRLFWKLRAECNAGKPDVGAAYPAVRVRRLDQMACVQMDKGDTAEARALLKQAADEMTRIAAHKEEGNDDRQKTVAERFADITERLAKLGHAIVPLGDRAGSDDDRAGEEPQPAGEPVSG